MIGTNLDSVKDYASHFAFADCFRMARAWGSAAAPYDGKAVLGPDGFPVGDFGTVLMTSVDSPGGIYKLSFQGKADVSFPGSQAKLQNLVFDGVKTTAEVVLAQGSQLFISFKNAVGVKNPQLIRPNCKEGDIFNPQFVESLKPYRALRFMDWLQTNNSPIKTWADRKRTDEIIQSGARGVALEYCIELCNLTGTDLWINMPHMTDDDYATQAASLVKAKLNPLLTIYVEYSNEVWNTIFTQTNWNYEQAKADVAAGQKDLSLEGTDTNTYYWGRRRVAKRAARIGVLFKNIIGGDRVRPILSTQNADVSVGRAQLGYLSKYFPRVSDAIFGLATAPYFSTQADEIAGATVQTILEGLNSSVKSNVASWVPGTWDGKTTSASAPSNATMAKYYGVPLFFYECGQHLLGDTAASQALDLEVQSTQGMGDAYAAYCEGMKDIPLAMHFVHLGTWSNHGYWGLAQSYGAPTPKLKAVLDACQKFNGDSMDQLKAQIDKLSKQLSDLTAQLIQSQLDKKALSEENLSLKAVVAKLQSDGDEMKHLAQLILQQGVTP